MNKVSSENKREMWLDVLRVIAILCVVLCHSVEGIYSFDVDQVRMLGRMERLFLVGMFTIARAGGVPVFLMLSGYLLLDKEYDSQKAVSFWKRNWLNLLISTQVWIVLFEVFLLFWIKQPIPPEYLLRAMFFLEPSSMYHMWYMPMILGFYLCIPLAANAFSKVDVKKLSLPIGVFFFYSFGLPFYTTMATIFGSRPVAKQFSDGFSGGAYGFYLILGLLIKRRYFEKVKTWILLFVLVASMALVTFIQYLGFAKGVDVSVWYDSPFVCILALCLFELIYRLRNKIRKNVLIGLLARYAFAVFLLHMVVRTMTMPWLIGLNLWRPVKVFIALWLFSLGGFLIALVIAKIPKIGKYILNVK